VALANELLDAFFPAGVFHPRERDVGGELVTLLLEAQLDQPWFDGLVQAGQLVAAVLDAEPDDADVVERREDAEAGELGGEGVDAGGRDRVVQRVGHLVEPVVRHVPEELQRDVGLLGLGEVQPRRSVEAVLYVGDALVEPLQVDADEETLSHT